MTKTVDYFMAPASPWTFFGHDRFAAMVERHGYRVNVRPTRAGDLFPVTGGLPVQKRAPARQAYRMIELHRWSEFLGIPIIFEPKYFPVDDGIAAHVIVAAAAASENGSDVFPLARALHACVWQDEADIADPDTVRAAAERAGHDGAALLASADSDAVAAAYKANTETAIEKGYFGFPCYVIEGEPFWGQDRLDFVERRMAGA